MSLQADRDVYGRQDARDPAAHSAGTEERSVFDGTRARIGTRIFLGRFVQEKKMNEALGNISGKKLLGARGFELE